MDRIIFQNKTYPSVFINLPFGLKQISTTKLNECLMDYDGNYVSEEARSVDEEIFYFLDEKFIYLNEDEIINKILSEI
jgi:hypothetical protein